MVIRNGDSIVVAKGTYTGRWRVFSVKNAKSKVLLNLGQSDTIKLLNNTDGHKINASLTSLLAGGLTVAGRDLTGG